MRKKLPNRLDTGAVSVVYLNRLRAVDTLAFRTGGFMLGAVLVLFVLAVLGGMYLQAKYNIIRLP